MSRAIVPTSKTRILFLCTGNSCRSQMAESLCRHFRSAELAPHSAGIESHGLNLLAVKAMSEIGIDISDYRSKTLNELAGREFDLVVTVCGHANELCPVFPGNTRVIHQEFDDPPMLAVSAASEEEALIVYRRVRDEIKQFILHLKPEILR